MSNETRYRVTKLDDLDLFTEKWNDGDTIDDFVTSHPTASVFDVTLHVNRLVDQGRMTTDPVDIKTDDRFQATAKGRKAMETKEWQAPTTATNELAHVLNVLRLSDTGEISQDKLSRVFSRVTIDQAFFRRIVARAGYLLARLQLMGFIEPVPKETLYFLTPADSEPDWDWSSFSEQKTTALGQILANLDEKKGKTMAELKEDLEEEKKTYASEHVSDLLQALVTQGMITCRQAQLLYFSIRDEREVNWPEGTFGTQEGRDSAFVFGLFDGHPGGWTVKELSADLIKNKNPFPMDYLQTLLRRLVNQGFVETAFYEEKKDDARPRPPKRKLSEEKSDDRPRRRIRVVPTALELAESFIQKEKLPLAQLKDLLRLVDLQRMLAKFQDSYAMDLFDSMHLHTKSEIAAFEHFLKDYLRQCCDGCGETEGMFVHGVCKTCTIDFDLCEKCNVERKCPSCGEKL
jgi:hypothetical protein